MGHSPVDEGLYKLRVNGVVEESIVDGPGLRYVVFTQGCPHKCKGCHNPGTHRSGAGHVLDIRDILRGFIENPLLSGITFSGGEPFLQPGPLSVLAAQVNGLGKNVAVYTGYEYEQLRDLARQDAYIGKLLDLTDILIDGPYVESLRNLELQYRGSSNQRVLELKNGRISSSF